MHRPAKTIVFTSPNLDVYKAFLKEMKSAKRYMPVWSLGELQECRSGLYNTSLSEDDVGKLFLKWGGRPRYVLEKAKEESSQMELEAMIGSCTPADVLKSAGEHRGVETASDRWVHVKNGWLLHVIFVMMIQVVGNSCRGRLLSEWKNMKKVQPAP